MIGMSVRSANPRKFGRMNVQPMKVLRLARRDLLRRGDAGGVPTSGAARVVMVCLLEANVQWGGARPAMGRPAGVRPVRSAHRSSRFGCRLLGADFVLHAVLSGLDRVVDRDRPA